MRPQPEASPSPGSERAGTAPATDGAHPHAGELAAQQAQLLFATLARAGLAHVVVSPGSRSTPLLLAAAACSGLTLHDVLDERAAAFFALGLARATGLAPALICTSGSAAAHYHPAVLEAAHAGLPLLLISADRPPEAWGRGAKQTIDQAALFRELCRSTETLPLPDGHPDTLRGLVHRAARALFETSHGQGSAGPVHLIAPFRKPLEPSGDRPDGPRASQAPEPPVVPLIFAARPQPDPAAIEALAGRCRESARGLIIAGPLAPLSPERREAVFALARATGYPLLAEAGSNLRLDGQARPERIDAFPAILACAIPEALRPELVIRLGGEPSPLRFAPLLAGPNTRTWLCCDGPAADGENRCEGILLGPVGTSCALLCEALGAQAEHDDPAAPSYLHAWQEADARLRARIFSLLDAEAPALNDAQVARAVITHLGDGEHLLLGNSLPLRMVDLAAFGEEARATVHTQRGVSGIDGLVAGCAGLATGLRTRVTALIGDLSLAHDLGGLALLARTPPEAPVTLVVSNNRGGRIFELLPIGEREALAPAMAAHLIMDSAPSFEHAARHFGLAYLRVETLAELHAALSPSQPSEGFPEARGASDHTAARGASDQTAARSASLLIETHVAPHAARDFFAHLAKAAEPTP